MCPSEDDLAVPLHCGLTLLWVDALKEGNEFSVDPILVDRRRGGVEDCRGGFGPSLWQEGSVEDGEKIELSIKSRWRKVKYIWFQPVKSRRCRVWRGRKKYTPDSTNRLCTH